MTATRNSSLETREKAIINSALWAAAGDALGWMTELGDEGTVQHRTGLIRVSETVAWRRRIGGKFGPTVNLPAGTYSDDTQLRLAVCRATGPTGTFDPELFAKVELPVWNSYSLGAGRGTTAAANNLTKPSVNWFNNFFSVGESRTYFKAGGNGAAMRIQPHVWKADPNRPDTFLPDVLRDAVITHGDPKGVGGAVFHALCVAHAIAAGSVPGPSDWLEFIQQLEYCEGIIRADDKLGLFWLKAWESKAGGTLGEAFKTEITEAQEAISRISGIADSPRSYEDVLTILGCFDEATRGAGIGTSIAAAVVAYYTSSIAPMDALRLAANSLGSDTDTIASMAGAIIGAVTAEDMSWELQDRRYIIVEARRMFELSQSNRVSAFNYPDLISWTPPSTQSDGVGLMDGKLFLAGFGELSGGGEEYETSDAIWQWANLPFGQSVLIKRRRKPRKLRAEDAPHIPAPQLTPPSQRQPDFFAPPPTSKVHTSKPATEIARRSVSIEKMDIESLTSLAIESGFEPSLLGRILLMLANRTGGIESSVAFSAIIAKAVQSRRRRNS